MNENILTATVTQVKIGLIEIEGLMLEDGRFAVAVPQIAKLFPYFKTNINNASTILKRLMGKDFRAIYTKTSFNKHITLSVYTEDFKRIVMTLASLGDAEAINFARLLDLPFAQTKRKKDKIQLYSHLYVIGDKERNVCKIGITSQLEKRLYTIQRYYPFNLEIWFTRKYENAKNIERIAHLSLSDYRLNGEWFLGDAFYMVDWSA